MQQNRVLLFVALGLLFLALAIELGAGLLVDPVKNGTQTDMPTPGYGVTYLALLDGLLFFALLMKVLAAVLPARVHGAAQGCLTGLVGLLGLLGGILMIIVAFLFLMLLLGLLMAVPFGTAIYFGCYGSFERGEAAATLSICMFLKLVATGCVLLSHPDELKTKATLLFWGCALLANFLVAWLHALLPRVLTSVTDVVAAIVVAVIGAIWALLLLLGAISPIWKTLKGSGQVVAG